MRKSILITTMILMISVLGVGCSTSKTANTQENIDKLPELSIGMMPATDVIPFIIAQQQGFDQKHGVKLDIQTFRSAKDRDAAFQAGKLDGVGADLIAIAIYNQGGLDVKITSTTFGGFSLLTGAADVKSVADLKGKSVIYSKNTSTEYAVSLMLKEVGLTEKDIKLTEVPQIPTRLELLVNNKADAAILPEPFVTMGKADGLLELNSTLTMGLSPFVIGFPEKTIAANEKAIQAAYAAYDEAVAYMKAHDQADYIDVIIKAVGYPETLKDQITVPDYPVANQVLVEEIDQAFSWAREKGLLKKNLTSEEVISDVAFKK
ncbi:MAG: ABC transporter substrate-binding protein [Gorillibacterium sp.]|nr:ABC transporter substrate-binding protein [Gorillibacterium sp.]